MQQDLEYAENYKIKEAENEITAIAAQDNITRVYDVFVLDKQRKIKQSNIKENNNNE